jgi:hypothetical protein
MPRPAANPRRSAGYRKQKGRRRIKAPADLPLGAFCGKAVTHAFTLSQGRMYPALLPCFYDFTANAWLYYFGGNAMQGGRSFYNFGGASAAAGYTTPGFIFL